MHTLIAIVQQELQETTSNTGGNLRNFRGREFSEQEPGGAEKQMEDNGSYVSSNGTLGPGISSRTLPLNLSPSM